MKYIYAALRILGTVLPLSQFIPWLLSHGLDFPLILSEITHPISAFAGLDVVISAIALMGFMFYEGQRLAMKHLWLPIMATLSIGVSLGLPLFLLLRELSLESQEITMPS